MSLVAANHDVYNLLRDGIPVEFDNAKGQKQQERVRLIDFNRADENRYLAVTQLWVKGERGFRRPDVLLYVNGLPLVFIELKNSNVRTRHPSILRFWQTRLENIRRFAQTNLQ